MVRKINGNKNNTLFSIIIPIYNCEKYIERCINSILFQDIDNFELILVNDGSTDSSNKICKEYEAKDKRIKLISKNNSGVSDTRNIGLKSAKGKYVLFLDSDDFVEKNYLSSVVEIITEHPEVELINFGFYSDVNSAGNEVISSDIINSKFLYMKNKQEIKENMVYLWDKHMLYNIWNKIYLKEVIDKNNLEFPKYNFGEDMEFNKRYLNSISVFLNSDKCFYHYIKERKGSITATYKEELFDVRINEYIQFNNYFKAQGLRPEEYLEFSSRRFIERVLGCIENICSSKVRLKERCKKIKKIVNNEYVIYSVRIAKPNSKKTRLMLFPVKIKSVFLLLIMGNTVGFIRRKYPGFFNKMKNRR